MSKKSLVENLENQSLNSLMSQNYSRIRGIISARAWYRQKLGLESEDLISMGCERLQKSFKNYDQKRNNFHAWASGVIFLGAIDEIRIQYGRSETKRSQRFLEQSNLIEESYITCNRPGPEEEMELNELRESFKKFMNQLKNKERDIFIYKFLEQKIEKEICKILGISRTTILFHTQNIRKKWRQGEGKQWMS